MNRLNKSKKGIEMSVNIIVMLVIGLTILGLVIGFVQGMFSNLDIEIPENPVLVEKVKSCKENLCVEPQPSLTIELGEAADIYIKVRSSGDGISAAPGTLLSTTPLGVEILDSTGQPPSATEFNIFGPGFDISQGQQDDAQYIFEPGTLPVGTYFAKFTLSEASSSGSPITSTKTITINIE